MKNERFVTILEKLGLNAPEARVYIALSELKESRTGELCEKADVASSKIYHVLESLIHKGFVSYRLQNNIKIFMTSPAQLIVDLFEEKQKRLLEEKKEMMHLMHTLKNLQSSEQPLSHYKYYEGISGIRALLLGLADALNDLPRDEPIMVYAGVKEAYEAMLAIYEDFHTKRQKLGIPYKIIYPYEEKEVSRKRKKQLAEVRFKELHNKAEWAILGNMFVIQYITGKTPRAFLIEDSVFAETFKQVFNQIWESAKK